MREIDGSHGEGGGQILRTAIAFSILTQTPVRINNIRANRPQPGLKPQHLTVVRMLASLSSADTTGLFIGSSTILFHPHFLKTGNFRFDVGTAGSVVLIAQTLILATLKTKKKIMVELTGGTDVKWAPSWDYFTNVFLPIIKKLGVNVELVLLKRGYYPKGGGSIRLIIHPSSDLNPISLVNPGKVVDIKGFIHSHGLPAHVMERMRQTVQKETMQNGYRCQIQSDNHPTISPGIILTLWTDADDRFLGAVGLGERGRPAETIATESVQKIVSDIDSGAMVDQYLFDQILGFLVCADGKSQILTPVLSSHAKTNIWLIDQFFHHKKCVRCSNNDSLVKVDVFGMNILG